MIPDVEHGFVCAFPCPRCSRAHTVIGMDAVRRYEAQPRWRRFVALPDADGATCAACGFVYANSEWSALRAEFILKSGYLSIN